jgi:hypothetical protein
MVNDTDTDKCAHCHKPIEKYPFCCFGAQEEFFNKEDVLYDDVKDEAVEFYRELGVHD